MPTTNINLTDEEMETAISGLLFSCSVNVVSDTDLAYQTKLLNLAKKLREAKPDVKLNSVRFIQEESYEDETSPDILNTFKNNIEITTFDYV